MNPKETVDDFLGPLEETWRKVECHFAEQEGNGSAVVPAQAPRSNDSVLVSLSAEATQLIHVFNPRAAPYEALFTPPRYARDQDYEYPDFNEFMRGFRKKVRSFVHTSLHPVVRQVHQENPWSRLVLVYVFVDGDFYTHPKIHSSDLIKAAISRHFTDIPRKQCIAYDILDADFLRTREEIDHLDISVVDTHVLQNARGYEARSPTGK